MIRHQLFIFVFLFLSSLVFAEQPRWQVPNSAKFEINPDGFDILSAEIATYLKEYENSKPFSFDKEVFWRFSIHGSNIRYHSKFSNLKFSPENGHIAFGVDVSRLSVVIPRLDLSLKNFWGITLTSCYSTVVQIGFDKPVRLSGKLHLQTDRGLIRTSASDVKFPIASSNYRVFGPKECTGGLLSYFIESAVSAALTYSRSVIERSITQQISSLMPTVGEQVNVLITRPINIPLSDFVRSLPNLQLNNFISKLKVSFSGLELVASPIFKLLTKQEEQKWENIESKLQQQSGVAGLMTLLKEKLDKYIGFAGMNPVLFSSLLKFILVSQNQEYFEVSADRFPILRGFLIPDLFIGLWPDLDNYKPEKIRFLVKLIEEPKISFKDNEHLTLHTKINIVLELYKKQKWQKYYSLGLQNEINLSAKYEDKKLVLGVGSDSKIKILNSAWITANYKPQDDTFDEEAFYELIGSVLTYAQSREQLVALKIPSYRLGISEILVGALKLQDPFAQLELYSRKP